MSGRRKARKGVAAMSGGECAICGGLHDEADCPRETAPGVFDEEACFQQLAASIVFYQERIRKVATPLSDENIQALVVKCRREAHPQPGDSHNFEIPEWDRVAEQLECELRYRRIFRRAAEHEAKTGSKTYCPHCDGDCTPEHIAEMSDD
jgi:hypothetical protein